MVTIWFSKKHLFDPTAAFVAEKKGTSSMVTIWFSGKTLFNVEPLKQSK